MVHSADENLIPNKKEDPPPPTKAKEQILKLPNCGICQIANIINKNMIPLFKSFCLIQLISVHVQSRLMFIVIFDHFYYQQLSRILVII